MKVHSRPGGWVEELKIKITQLNCYRDCQLELSIQLIQHNFYDRVFSQIKSKKGSIVFQFDFYFVHIGELYHS